MLEFLKKDLAIVSRSVHMEYVLPCNMCINRLMVFVSDKPIDDVLLRQKNTVP